MNTKKQFVENREGLKMAVVIEEPEGEPRGLAFVLHGFGGSRDQIHIKTFADAFREKGFTVVRFDTTNSLGNSGGTFADFVITGMLQDLEDVIAWAKQQSWYIEPFCLTGHSSGSYCCCVYAANHPDEIQAIAPISVLYSGKDYIESFPKEKLDEWNRIGWRTEPSPSKPGMVKKLKWHQFCDDALTHSIEPHLQKLTMPTLLIIGENDTAATVEQHKRLVDALPGDKELHVIKGSGHTFRKEIYHREIKAIIQKWIDSLIDGNGPR